MAPRIRSNAKFALDRMRGSVPHGAVQRTNLQAGIMHEVIILGAGIVGLSTAVNLALRGVAVTLVDRKGVGAGASYGNGGLIQREAVAPYPFPRAWGEILTHALRRSVTVNWQARAMPALAGRLLRYWQASAPAPYRRTVIAQAVLIGQADRAHLDLADRIGPEVRALYHPTGWMRIHSDAAQMASDIATAEGWRRDFGVEFDILDGAALRAAEPDFIPDRAGALHWTQSPTLRDPQALLDALAAFLQSLGGRILRGDAMELTRIGPRWRLPTDQGMVEASDVVVAAGAWSAQITARFGFAPPVFGKRGYHRHYALRDGARLSRPIVDKASGFLLAPMARGVRLTTGVEFAGLDDAQTPVQLERCEAIARNLLPLADAVEQTPWMGIRPCSPDMRALVGPAPGISGMWCAFGHGHQGMTLGPLTGQLLGAMMVDGERPDWLTPFDPSRFSR